MIDDLQHVANLNTGDMIGYLLLAAQRPRRDRVHTRPGYVGRLAPEALGQGSSSRFEGLELEFQTNNYVRTSSVSSLWSSVMSVRPSSQIDPT